VGRRDPRAGCAGSETASPRNRSGGSQAVPNPICRDRRVIYTLIADGTSDFVLLPLITWSLKKCGVTPVVEQWADLNRIPRTRNTEERLRMAVDLYPCDALFVHRDAEGQNAGFRRAEIANALRWANIRHIPVVPVRMTEAWLLPYDVAIRNAAGNPNGTMRLNLPNIRRLEDLPDPKNVLHDALIAAKRPQRPASHAVAGSSARAADTDVH
jgi:hypothetical protein